MEQLETLGDGMGIFVTVIEASGFSAAASRIGVTPSAISKAVSRLETRLGVRLIQRTTRRIALTAEGEHYYAEAKNLIREIESLEASVAGARTEPRGTLRVNCGMSFGLYQLLPRLPHFQARFPRLKLDVQMSDRQVDLVANKVDVAIRHGHLEDSSLAARPICELYRHIVASPAYLQTRGAPQAPEELRDHNCITLTGLPQLARWRFGQRGQPEAEVVVRGDITTDNAEGVVQLALAGAGIARLMDVVLSDHVRRGALVPLLLNHHIPEATPISAVFAQGAQRNASVRAFVDFLVAEFGHAPWRAALAMRVDIEPKS